MCFYLILYSRDHSISRQYALFLWYHFLQPLTAALLQQASKKTGFSRRFPISAGILVMTPRPAIGEDSTLNLPGVSIHLLNLLFSILEAVWFLSMILEMMQKYVKILFLLMATLLGIYGNMLEQGNIFLDFNFPKVHWLLGMGISLIKLYFTILT